MPVDFGSPDAFADRHIGPNGDDVAEMLRVLGLASLDQLVTETVPADIRLSGELSLPGAVTEAEALAVVRASLIIGSRSLSSSTTRTTAMHTGK